VLWTRPIFAAMVVRLGWKPQGQLLPSWLQIQLSTGPRDVSWDSANLILICQKLLRLCHGGAVEED
jgi:hypothetical protein